MTETEPWPILAFEMIWWGTTHAPGNGSTLQTIALAFPGHPLHVFAEPGHVAELRRNAALGAARAVSFHEVRVSRVYPGRPGIVALRRFAREALTINRALRLAPRGRRCLLVLLSASSTAMFAAGWLAWWRGRDVTAVQVGLHGNAHDAFGWRTRNPALRALDTQSAFARLRWLRFLVLEPNIRDALAARNAAVAARIDVLKLPINIAEFDTAAAPEAPPPLRIGFVGQGTAAKGIDIFLRVARALRARHGERIAFHLIGRAMPGSDAAAFAPLAELPQETQMPRAEFVRRLARMHYIMLPFQPGYYDLAASGALIDAVTWLKPVLALRVGFVEALFAEAGDIGFLCADEQALQDTLEGLLGTDGRQRYDAQVAALRRARARRLPDALAPDYRDAVLRGFPFLATAR